MNRRVHCSEVEPMFEVEPMALQVESEVLPRPIRASVALGGDGGDGTVRVSGSRHFAVRALARVFVW